MTRRTPDILSGALAVLSRARHLGGCLARARLLLNVFW